MSNQLWVIFDTILFFLLIIPFLNSIKWSQSAVRFQFSAYWVKILFGGCVIFCLYNKTEGDYFHYEEFINEINSVRVKDPVFEIPYMFLISIIGNNYFLFRLFVWGTALFLYNQTLELVNLKNNLSVSIFILFTLVAFAYGRVSLALSVFYFGAIYCYVNWEKCRYFKSIFGVAIVGFSLFFHKSMFVPVALFLVLCFFRLSRKKILLLICLLPIIVSLLSSLLSDILAIQSSFGEINRGIYYLNGNETLGLSMIISLLLSFFSMILLMVMMGKDFYSKQNLNIPIYIKKMYEMAFFLILISFVLLLVGSGNRYLYSRIREMSYIPFSVILSYYFISFNTKKWVLAVSLAAIFLQNVFYFAYAYYLKSIGTGI